MQLDIEDVLASTVGRVFLLVFFMLSAAWVGSLIAGLAWFIGNWDLSVSYLLSEFPKPWVCPALLLSEWSFPSIAVLGAGIAILFVTDHIGYAAWGIFVGLESVFAMLGTSYAHKPVGNLVLIFIAWLVVLTMVETGIWLTRQIRMNRWAHQMAALSAENSIRRAEREALARDEEQKVPSEDGSLTHGSLN